MTNDEISIMIVDDKKSMTSSMSRVLNRMGYDVETAGSGREAIEIAKEKERIDIVFLDIKMPVMNGVETYKQLKTIIPQAAVIMMTAYAVEDLIQEALEEGAFGVIYKPLDLEKVDEKIEKALEIEKGALILVVDDDSNVRRSFDKALTKKGYSVIAAESGEEAVNLAAEEEFDVLFIDLRLPEINGLETYLKVKETNPSAVAVIVTAYAQDMNALVEQALLEDAYSCMQKPIDLGKVNDLVNLVMEAKRE
ncbi:MAG: response regulator [Candidatus Thorarchaeota archaeon]|nr:response regulator [Candidatus Thorarchaeota archaeon]